MLFFQAMYINRDRIPLHLHIIYGAGNLALNCLNALWFSKMFAKMIARIHGDDEIKPSAKPVSRTTTGAAEKEPLLSREGDDKEGGLTLPVSPPSPVATVRKEVL